MSKKISLGLIVVMIVMVVLVSYTRADEKLVKPKNNTVGIGAQFALFIHGISIRHWNNEGGGIQGTFSKYKSNKYNEFSMGEVRLLFALKQNRKFTSYIGTGFGVLNNYNPSMHFWQYQNPVVTIFIGKEFFNIIQNLSLNVELGYIWTFGTISSISSSKDRYFSSPSLGLGFLYYIK